MTSDNEIVLTHRFQPDGEIIFSHKPTLKEFLDIGAPEGETALSLQSFFQKYSKADCYFLIDCAHGIEEIVCNWIGKNVNPEVRKHLIFQVHTQSMLYNIYKTGVFENIHYNGEARAIIT